MESPVVKTTFIPRQDMGLQRKRSTYRGVFSLFGVLFLVVALGGWGGMMLYREKLKTDKISLESDLATKTQNIDRDLINELKQLDAQLLIAEELLNGHTTLAPVFRFLSDSTLSTSVRYEDFHYTASDGIARVELSGTASNFSALNYQAEVLKENDTISEVFFENLSVNTETGDVEFNLSFNISHELISYASMLGAEPPAVE